jgi:hypothetical protein
MGLEWKDPSMIWVGSSNPCSMEDMEIFYAATQITVGNSCKTPFGRPLGCVGEVIRILRLSSSPFRREKREN